MDDRLCFVQFLHPGGEHEPDAGRVKTWNRRDHRRKFLKSPGRFLETPSAQVQDGEIVFWGEWEPESVAVVEIGTPLPDGPRWIYEPYFVLPEGDPDQAWYSGRQNTDPFVFGDRFRYTGCLQHTKRGPTQLRHLARASVILFGSCLHKSRFVVDTVFVVADHIDHTKRDHQGRLRSRVPATYEAVTLAPWYVNTDDPTRSHRLYTGATFDARVEGMFSFFPCLPYSLAPRGFARPTIRLPGIITDTHRQWVRLNPQLSTADVAPLWEEVVRQVTDQGLMLGIGAPLPPAAAADQYGIEQARISDIVNGRLEHPSLDRL